MDNSTGFRNISDENFDIIIDQIFNLCDKHDNHKVQTEELCEFIITYLKNDKEKIKSLNNFFAPYNGIHIDKQTFKSKLKDWLRHIRQSMYEDEIIGDVANDGDYDKLQFLSKINELELENVSLKKEICNLKTSTLDDYSQLKIEIEQCETEKQNLIKANNEIKIKLKDEKRAIQNLEKWNDDLTKKIDDMKKEQHILRDEFDLLKMSKLTVEKDSVAFLNEIDKLAKENKQLKLEISKQKTENLNLQKLSDKRYSVINQYEFEVENIMKKMKCETEKVENIEREYNSLKNKYDEIVKGRDVLIDFVKTKMNANDSNEDKATKKANEFLESITNLQNSEFTGSSSFSDNKPLWNSIVDFIKNQITHNESVVTLDSEIKYMKLYETHQKCEEKIDDLKIKKKELDEIVSDLQLQYSQLKEAYYVIKTEYEKLTFTSESNKDLLKDELGKLRQENIKLIINHNQESNQLKGTLRYLKNQIQYKNSEVEKLSQKCKRLAKDLGTFLKYSQTTNHQILDESSEFRPIYNYNGYDTVDNGRFHSKYLRFLLLLVLPTFIVLYFVYIYYNYQNTYCYSQRFSLTRWLKNLFDYIFRSEEEFFF